MGSPNELIKPALYAACAAFIAARIAAATTAMQAAQEAANSHTKSSAGDKYETGREMATAERDRHAGQLHQARQLHAELARISPDAPCDAVRPGALVHTSRGWFYLAIGAGEVVLDGQAYFAVSAAAPVALALRGKRVGEEAVFNGQALRVLAVR